MLGRCVNWLKTPGSSVLSPSTSIVFLVSKNWFSVTFFTALQEAKTIVIPKINDIFVMPVFKRVKWVVYLIIKNTII